MKASSFQHQWARAKQARRALAFHNYAPAAALAAADKFVHPGEDRRSALARFDYGLRLDPLRYRERLLHHARAAGVEIREGKLAGVERQSERMLAALLLSDGTKLEADLFLDCAGPSAPLLAELDGSFEDWGEFLPCDRFLLAEGPQRPASPVDVAEATPTGWRFAFPLPSRTLIGAGFASSLTEEEEARAGFASDAERVEIRPGRRPKPWIGNVLALGDAAVAVDPLQATNLHLAESAIRRALSLLPGPDFHPLVLEEYNRRTRLDADRVRDFIAVHYLASRRTDGTFWKHMPRRAKPASLAHTLEQFEGRGRLPTYEEESFSTDSWLAVLFGLGVQPRRIDPTAFRIDFEESVATMERMAQMAAALPAQLPLYDEYLARLKAG
jgi:tryptophan halogenase